MLLFHCIVNCCTIFFVLNVINKCFIVVCYTTHFTLDCCVLCRAACCLYCCISSCAFVFSHQAYVMVFYIIVFCNHVGKKRLVYRNVKAEKRACSPCENSLQMWAVDCKLMALLLYDHAQWVDCEVYDTQYCTINTAIHVPSNSQE